MSNLVLHLTHFQGFPLEDHALQVLNLCFSLLRSVIALRLSFTSEHSFSNSGSGLPEPCEVCEM